MDTQTKDQYQNIGFEDSSWRHLSLFMEQASFSQLIVLTDKNTEKYCLPKLQAFLKAKSIDFEHLTVQAGEANKTLRTAEKLWERLTELKADRSALLLNLGGGVVCDLGGFVASVYKRGIRFSHLPTSLLAMVDASIGGKCGVDFIGFKNQLGTFKQAEQVFINPIFLKTLPENELLSGFAEVIKHALIADKDYWNQLLQIDLSDVLAMSELIEKSVKIKRKIVAQDPFEENQRKQLNFGHTIGHAIESYFLEKEKPMPHGFAVAAGMICESYLSVKIAGLEQAALEEIEQFIDGVYRRLQINSSDLEKVCTYLLQDKKNKNGKSRFTLLDSIGSSTVDNEVDINEVQESLIYYLQL